MNVVPRLPSSGELFIWKLLKFNVPSLFLIYLYGADRKSVV